MTEFEWRTSSDPDAMLLQLEDEASARKLRLFGCACCRRIWDRLPHEANRRLVVAVEEHPDGNFDDPDLNEALVASTSMEYESRSDDAYWAVKYLGRTYYKFTPLGCARTVAQRAAQKVGEIGDYRIDETIEAAERGAQAALVREVFGNPFRPVSIDPTWLGWKDGLVARLARSIDESRDFNRLPALADALEEAGCADGELLAHCRESGGHVRGCWVVDLLLGKE